MIPVSNFFCEPLPGAKTEVIEPQDTRTTSVSLEIIEMNAVDNLSELRNNSAFDFWNASAEDIYED